MIKVIFKNTESQTLGNITIQELIKGMGLDPQSILAVKDGKLVNNGTRLGNQGEIRLIPVISGG